ncbi:MAG: phosphoribosyltransferase family protein [Arenicellales bacterium]|jgi:hypothetical protein|nr:hypoxanthine phosphoribosyltransferase [Acidiferrobacteraceae bacterium]MDP6123513.1 phosphoribosyltransferase family protein [Arenicellales bacterium]MDP6289185.1 phosphoribosyltransferase family protein [Arenicellales bacterium]MDP7154980.1 phosphoribosyltransferase family protein [Arenicellales bacterium]MDP7283960.1 phosphoribosyltransferase family protein [Arenicellales bacterium]|tara:strand:- start:6287 stop:6850 length:564 start_codon:yes stop_codon:yes gene_type:complete
MTDKIYITAEDLLIDSFRLGAEIINSGFEPNFIIGVWRGGTPVGIAVQELLDYHGFKTDHIAIRTSSYRGIGDRGDSVMVHGLGYLIRKINAEDRLLIVDDVYDSGLSVKAVLDTLSARARKNTPNDIRIATPWFKPGNNKSGRIPDYYLHETERWLVFPHELDGVSKEELIENKPGIESIFSSINH